MAVASCSSPTVGGASERNLLTAADESAPLVSSPMTSSSLSTTFSGDEKIGREVVVLEDCSNSSSRNTTLFKTESLDCSLLVGGGGVKGAWPTEESDSDVIPSGRRVARRQSRARREPAKPAVKEETMEEEEELSEQQMATEVPSGVRLTRSMVAKLVSDSELSHSESDPAVSVGAGGRRRVSLSRRGGDVRGEGVSLVPGESGGEGEGEVTVVAESGEDHNETLVGSSGPISARTRSQIESSQSEGEGDRTGKLRPKRHNRSRRRPLVAMETSHSESESSVAMVTDPAPSTQASSPKGGRRTRCKTKSSNVQGTVSVESTTNSVMSSPTAMMSSDPAAQSAGLAKEVVAAGERLSDWYIRIVGKNLVVVEGAKK